MYKLYQSKKNIPWITISMNLVPDINIQDSFFNFELVTTNVINFVRWDTGNVVISDLSIKYFMIEKNNQKTYWYVNKVNRVLKDGYEVELKLDVWMSFGKTFFNKLIENNISPVINRAYFNTNMLRQSETLKHLIFYSFYIDDEIMEMEYSYKKITQFVSNYKEYEITGGENNFYWPVLTDFGRLRGSTGNEIIGLGYYLIMLRIDGSSFDCFPLMSQEINQDGNKKLNNRVQTLITKVGYNKVDNKNVYNENSFQGIYRGPVLLSRRSTGGAYETAYHVVTSDNETNLHIYQRIYSFTPFNVRFPRINIPFHNDLIENYIEGLQPYYWGNGPVYLRKLFSYIENDVLKNNRNYWNIDYDVTFIGGFVATPKNSNQYISTEDIIYFGEQLPSTTNEYNKQIKNIQTTFDTGIINSTLGFIQGIPAAIGKGAANPVWGITAGINSAVTLGRDIGNMLINKKVATRNAKIGYNTTSNSNYFSSQYWYSNMVYSGLATLNYETIDGKSVIPFKTGCFVKEFSDQQKDQIRFILSQYGFLLNNNLPLQEWWNYVGENDKAAIKFDSVWISTNIGVLDSMLNIEQQDRLIDLLSGGIIINREWK